MGGTTKPVSRSIARTFVVALLGLLVVITTLPGLSLVWDSTDSAWDLNGELGFQSDYDGNILVVTPGSPAARAGIVAGDRVDLFRTPFEDRAYLAGSPARAPAHLQVRFWVNHRGVERQITLETLPAPYPAISRFNLVCRTLAALIFVIVGGSLVLLRPSRTTWGFYLYCLGFSPGIAYASFSRFPSPVMHAVDIIGGDLLTAAGTAGILVFALHFLCDDPAPWRKILDRSTPGLAVVFACLIVYPDVANLLLGWPAEVAQRIMLAVQGLIFALSIFAVLQTYIHGTPQERPRIQWVVVGLVVGTIGTYLGSILAFSSELPIVAPRWFQSLLLLLNVTLPLTVAYAVVRHRVFEVSFVVSRALVYAVLTSLIIGTFALIEWFVGHQLSQARLATIFEIATALGVSFWVNSLEARIEKFVDAVFFRRRREALNRLARDAEAVHHATQNATVDDYLIREPTAALALSSAALFRSNNNASFERVLAEGWPADAASKIEHDNPLVLTLESEWEPLRLAEIGWNHPDVPAANQAPILAVPVVAQRKLAAFVLYGAHSNGTDLDPEEVRSIFHLCRAAQATYDELRVEELTALIQDLHDQVARLQNGSLPQRAVKASGPSQTS